MKVTGYIYNRQGQTVGNFTREVRLELSTNTLSVNHYTLNMVESAQGGVGQAFNAATIKQYRDVGVDHITVEAGLDVGGYAWAREGFRLENRDGYTRHEQLHNVVSEGRFKLRDRVYSDPDMTYEKHQQIVKAAETRVDSLMRASKNGEDVQPIHIASVGEDDLRFRVPTGNGGYRETWPGKEMLLGTTWNGVYYFDARPVVASATCDHGNLVAACYDASCRPPTSGGTGGSSKRGYKASPSAGDNGDVMPDVRLGGVRVTYDPDYPDGGPDPGEIVWAKIPFEDDPTQSKDRPVLVIGRVEGSTRLAAVQLTSQIKGRGWELPIGSGSWDRSGKPSAINMGRIVQIGAKNYRREGSKFDEKKFDAVIGRLAAYHRTPVNRAVVAASQYLELAFNPGQPRDKDGKWTVGVQHVANATNAQAIVQGGFSTDTPAWDRSFGDGVYLGEAGDTKSAKFYARQGGRDWRTSQIVEGTVSLKNPLHVEATFGHSEFRQQVVEKLGGVDAVRKMVDAKHDAAVNIAKRIAHEELKPVNPEEFTKLNLDEPDLMFLWSFNDAATRFESRFEREAGMKLYEVGDLRQLSRNLPEIAKRVTNQSDQFGDMSRYLGNLARDAGYDGIVINTQRWGGTGGTQIVAFDPATINVTGVRPYAKNRAVTAAAEWLEEFYNAGQPRDKNGRWSKVGGRSTSDAASAVKCSPSPCVSESIERMSLARSVMHRRIVREVLASGNPPPHVTILGGGGGAGKSTIVRKYDLGKGQAVVNADDIKEKIPEYNQLVKAGDMSAAAFVHEESSKIAKDVQAEARQHGVGLLLDQVGSNPAKVTAQVRQFVRAGYTDIDAVYVTVPTQVAVDRAQARAQRSGRAVPEAILRAAHRDVSRGFEEIAALPELRDVKLYDNTGAEPVLIASGGRGAPLVIHDRALYDQFLAKGEG